MDDNDVPFPIGHQVLIPLQAGASSSLWIAYLESQTLPALTGQYTDHVTVTFTF